MRDDSGIDQETVGRLVGVFYEKVRSDAELGPVFDDNIADWPLHLARLRAFWSSVMLGSGIYKGSPIAAHMVHRARLTAPLFARWLTIWAEATSRELSPEAAAAFQAKAARIAESLQLALAYSPQRRDAHAAGGAASST